MSKKISKKSLEELKSRSNNNCEYCGEDLDKAGYHIEHVVPKSKWVDGHLSYGKNNILNLKLSCPECNREKYNRNLEEYRQFIMRSRAKKDLKLLFEEMIESHVKGNPYKFYFEKTIDC